MGAAVDTLKMIPIAAPQIGDEERRAVLEVLDSGQLAQGPVVEAFEREFAEWCGVANAVAVANGTAALRRRVGPPRTVVDYYLMLPDDDFGGLASPGNRQERLRLLREQGLKCGEPNQPERI